MKEWRTIEAHPDYEVCTDGTVRTKARYIKKGNSKSLTWIESVTLKPMWLNKCYCVSLKARTSSNRITKSLRLIVWRTFVGELDHGTYLAAIDGNDENASLDNLKVVESCRKRAEINRRARLRRKEKMEHGCGNPQLRSSEDYVGMKRIGNQLLRMKWAAK